MNHYKVEAKCGHVGRNNYIKKTFYLCANDKREAAYIVRWLPRVKHHHKDAIISVKEIDYEEYRLGLIDVHNDPYFNVHNSSDQRFLCDIDEDIYKENEEIKYKKITHSKRYLIEEYITKEWKAGRNYAYE